MSRNRRNGTAVCAEKLGLKTRPQRSVTAGERLALGSVGHPVRREQRKTLG